MAGQIQVVNGTSDTLQYRVSLPRSAIARIDVLDVDFVLETKTGDHVILPGAALEAMAHKPPAVHFSDGTVSSADLLAEADKVETRTLPVPVVATRDDKVTKKKAVISDGSGDGAEQVEDALQQLQQMAPLPREEGHTLETLLAKADTLNADIRKKAFDPAPPKIFEPPPAAPNPGPGQEPRTTKIPIVIALSEGNVVGINETGASSRGGKIILGSGGPVGSDNLLVDDPDQYGTETLLGGAGSDEIYADGFSHLSRHNTPSTFADGHLDRESGQALDKTPLYYAKQFELSVAGYMRSLDMVTVTLTQPNGKPIVSDAFTIDGLAQVNGRWNLPVNWVVPNTHPFVLSYDVTKVKELKLGDVYFCFDIVYSGQSGSAHQLQKFLLRFADVSDISGVTSNPPVYIPGSGWSPVYVMPTASAPHFIDAGDGENIVHAGNSNDTIFSGSGNDTIYAYAGNDTITAGDGANTVFAGMGHDLIITGTGNDVIVAGDGNNIVEDSGGNNTATAGDGDDTITTGDGNDVLILGRGRNTVTDGGGTNSITTAVDSASDVITVTGDGNNTITVGIEDDDITDGNDTVITSTGIDLIHVGDGDNLISTGDGNKTIFAGRGNDRITTGGGNDIISAGGGTNILDAGDGNNVVTTGDGNDSIKSGSGNDRLNLGGGSNTVTDTGGDNTITTNGIEVVASDGDEDTPPIAVQSATDVITITGNGNNIITVGLEDDDLADGDDTVTTKDGIDIISVGDGKNVVVTGNGSKTIIAGSGNDTVSTGNGNDTLTLGGGSNTVTDEGGDNVITTTGIEVVVDDGDEDTPPVAAQNATDVITITGDGNNTITVGLEDDDLADGDDTITTKNGMDIIHVGDGNNKLSAGDGNKTIFSGNGDDVISMGNGTHHVTDSGGANVINTTGGDDFIEISGDGDNNISVGIEDDGAADGDDTVTTKSGIDIIHVGDGNNHVSTGDGNKTIFAGSGNDVITVGQGDNNIVWAGDGDNTLTGGGGADTLIGGSGRDRIQAGAGSDWLYGGAGGNGTFDGGVDVDWLSFNGISNTDERLSKGALTLADWLVHAGVAVDGVSLVTDEHGSGTAYRISAGEQDAIANIENIIGSFGHDILDLSAYATASHVLYGLAGDDVLKGSDLADTLFGGTGQDSLMGGAGDDVLFLATTGVYSSAAAILQVGIAELSEKDPGTGTLTYRATKGSLDFTFADIYNFADGGAGADIIIGGDANDYFIATANEGINGGAADSFWGGLGTDTIDFSSYNTGLTVELGAGTAVTAGTTVARFSSVERVLTGTGNDSLTGTANNEVIWVGDGNDVVRTGAGTDTVWGGAGNDTIYAESGNDSLYGEAGDDTLLSYVGPLTASLYLNGGSGNNNFYLYGVTETVDARDGAGDTVIYSSSDVSGASATVNPGTGNTTVYFGIFANLSSTDYGLSQGGDLVGNATNSYWWTGIGSGTTRWSQMGTGVNGYQWQAQNAGRGYYGNAQNDQYLGAENITGTRYADLLIGSDENNTISGGGGNDALYGLGGNDYFGYGSGNAYIDGGASSAVSLTVAGVVGGDTLDCSTQTGTMSINLVADGSGLKGTLITGTNTVAFLGIENFIGGAGDDTINGTEDGNYLVGGLGNDTLYGHGGDDIINLGQNRQNLTDIGADSADGGTGTDWIIYSGINSYNNAMGVEIRLDQARTGAAAGWTQYAKITIGAGSYKYADLAGFENVQGSGYNDLLVGNAGNNILWGLAGADTMIGGSGDDTYYVDSGSDLVSEIAGQGTDTIYTTVSHTLATNVEILIGTGTANLVLNGNAQNNTLIGSSGNDTINGGTGSDVMIGGLGNDVYYVDSLGDSISEAADAGIDTVYTTVNYTLGTTIENLSANVGTGLMLTGNAAANIITGGNGSDTLDGGIGADTLNGGSGSDTAYYYASDAVSIDLLQAGASTVYRASGGDAEGDRLISIESIIGSNVGGDVLIGDRNANILWGNGGDDVIKTAAAVYGSSYTNISGADTLVGGYGNDTLHIYQSEASTVTVDGGGGTDTLVAADWTFNNFANTRFNSIETIDLRGATDITTLALSYTTINDLLDSGATGGKLTLYLDGGDRFTTNGSTAGNGVVGDPGGSHLATYTYAGGGGSSHQVEVHWGA